MSCLVFVLVVLLGVAGFLWGAAEFTRSHPLDLTAQLPKVSKYALPDGMSLEAEKVELFFDNGPVLRVNGLGVKGTDGTMGIFVEQAAIKLAATQLLLLSPAPKVIEAHGVTLRLVRTMDGVSIAGLSLPKGKSDEGVVEWLNGLTWSRLWGRIKTVKVADLNLLVRDDVQHAEWVLENGNMTAGRYDDEGEKGTLTAVVRRLYGADTKLKELDNVPVMVSFAHAYKADGLIVRGRIDRADAQMVVDYFPPQFKDLLQAQGQVEVGTRVMEGNQIERPWLTLRLNDVVVQPPKGFSSALKFPKLEVTASYLPPVEGDSESDILILKNLAVTTSRGSEVEVSGTISGLQTDPLVDLRLKSAKGEIQGIFDLMPDQERGIAKALHWLRPNIPDGDYSDLTAHYLGKPSAFPGCGENCGTLDIDAKVSDGTVRFLKEMTPAKIDKGVLQWRGETLTVTAPQGKIGGQTASNVKVSMGNIFAVSPTELRVTANLRGDAHELIGELRKLPETNGKIPVGINGAHASQMDIYVPMPRGEDPSFALSTVLVTSTITGVSIEGLDELKGLKFAAPAALVTLSGDKTLRVVGDGTLGDNPMSADWSMNIAPHMPSDMRLVAKGTVTGDWLMKQADTDLVSMTGPVGISLNLHEDKPEHWVFSTNADARNASVTADDIKFTKPKGDSLLISAAGAYVPSTTISLEKLDIQGNKVSVGGSLRWEKKDFGKSIVNLPTVKLGATDANFIMQDGKATISGKKLDLSGFDLFGSDDASATTPKTEPENLLLNLNVAEMAMEKGSLQNVVASLKATHGKWDVLTLKALVDNHAKVSIVTTPLRGQGARKRLSINIDDLGLTLSTLGIYDKLNGGKMSGEITYDTPDVGGGLIKLEQFELKNPPVLVQLLSLLSLEQLLAGTSSTLFKTGTVPVRVDNGVWYVDNASFEGPSMSLRLDGSYDRNAKQLDMDGKMAPAIPLNRLVGKIPLLGTILTGSQDGVVVADFKLKGPTSDPQINVRPLSVITPGLLKDFWRGLTGSNDTKPKPKVIDGRTK